MQWFKRLPIPIRIAGFVAAIACGALVGRFLAAASGADSEPLITQSDLIHVFAISAMLCVLYYVASFVPHRMMQGIDE